MQTSSVKSSQISAIIAALLDASEKVSLKIKELDNHSQIERRINGNRELSLHILVSDALKATGLVSHAISDKNPEPLPCDGNEFIVTFESLDDSSLIDCTWAAGLIFAIWPNTDLLQGLDGHSIISAGIVCCGTRTTAIYYDVDEDSVNEYKLGSEGENNSWIKLKSKLSIKNTKLYGPGYCRATPESLAYMGKLDLGKLSKHSMRYTGGLAPDCYSIFLKSGGIFCGLIPKSSQPKLGLLYACQPIAFLIEKAGGMSTDGEKSVLDVKIQGFKQKIAFSCGSADEIKQITNAIADFEARAINN